MFIRRAEANWQVLHFSTFVPDNNDGSLLEKVCNEEENGDEDLDVLDDEANKDMDNNAVDGPTVLAHVELCRTVCKYTIALLGFDLYFFVTDRQLPITDLAMEINQPCLIEHVRRFLYDQLYSDSDLPSSDISLNACPTFLGKVSIFLSAIATYYAPSNSCGIGGMHCKYSSYSFLATMSCML